MKYERKFESKELPCNSILTAKRESDDLCCWHIEDHVDGELMDDVVIKATSIPTVIEFLQKPLQSSNSSKSSTIIHRRVAAKEGDMIKRDELTHGSIAKADNDEPVFVLRAQDRLAPHIVRLWANTALSHGVHTDKVVEAFDLADQMEAWAKKKGSKVPD